MKINKGTKIKSLVLKRVAKWTNRDRACKLTRFTSNQTSLQVSLFPLIKVLCSRLFFFFQFFFLWLLFIKIGFVGHRFLGRRFLGHRFLDTVLEDRTGLFLIPVDAPVKSAADELNKLKAWQEEFTPLAVICGGRICNWCHQSGHTKTTRKAKPCESSSN